MLDRTQFENIEEFFGADWLQKGCDRLRSDIEQMVSEGWMDITTELRAHPIHQLWYKFILGQALPSDLIRGRSNRIDHFLGQIHRLLTLEHLLNTLRPMWNSGVAVDIRNKLCNPEQFAPTLYELEVVDNFRRAGYEVQLRAPKPGAPADIGGVIHRIPCDIECKRMGFKSQNYLDRQQMWAGLLDSILTELKRLGQSACVNIAFYATPTKSDLHAITRLFRELEEIPVKGVFKEYRGRCVIHLERVPVGRIRLDGDLDRFELLHVSGAMTPDGAESTDAYVVGIQDHVPFDWSTNVRKTLKSAISQLNRTKCNLVCLEVADLANSETPDEFWRVQEGIQLFLERDTRRVSAVLLTISGIVPEGPMTYRSAGQSWLFRHPSPYVTLPESFKAPSFDYPRVRVRASVQETNPQ